MVATMNASTFMARNVMDNENSIKNSTDLTLKKMFDISEKLVSEQEEINNVDNLLEKSFMETAVIGDETVINLQRTKVYFFGESLCCACERSINIQNPTKLGRKRLNASSMRKATETLTQSMESRLNSSGTFSKDSLRCSSAVKSHIN